MIEFDVKISLKEYRNMNFRLLYGKKFYFNFLTLIGLIQIICAVTTWVMPDAKIADNPAILFGLGCLFTFLMPVSIWTSSSRNYDSNAYLQEETHWTVTESSMKIEGKSFKSESDWSTVHKISRVGKNILIYKSRAVATIIPVRCFKSDADMQTFYQYAAKNNIKVD